MGAMASSPPPGLRGCCAVRPHSQHSHNTAWTPQNTTVSLFSKTLGARALPMVAPRRSSVQYHWKPRPACLSILLSSASATHIFNVFLQIKLPGIFLEGYNKFYWIVNEWVIYVFTIPFKKKFELKSCIGLSRGKKAVLTLFQASRSFLSSLSRAAAGSQEAAGIPQISTFSSE